jgi:hypothetical protein
MPACLCQDAQGISVAQLTFDLPDGTRVPMTVTTLLNAGYAGRRQDAVAAHVRELAALGVPAPSITPSLYPVAPYLAMQADEVFVSHDRTSGEGEWALVVAGPAGPAVRDDFDARRRQPVRDDLACGTARSRDRSRDRVWLPGTEVAGGDWVRMK